MIDFGSRRLCVYENLEAWIAMPLFETQSGEGHCFLLFFYCHYYTHVSSSYHNFYFQGMQVLNPSQALASANIGAGSCKLLYQPYWFIHILQFYCPSHFSFRAPTTISSCCFLVESTDEACTSPSTLLRCFGSLPSDEETRLDT